MAYRPLRGQPRRAGGHRPGERVGFSEEFLAKVGAEPRSNITFEIEDLGPMVKLTVVHDDFEAGSLMLETISQGWPMILANLKTLLETGETVPAPTAAQA